MQEEITAALELAVSVTYMSRHDQEMLNKLAFPGVILSWMCGSYRTSSLGWELQAEAVHSGKTASCRNFLVCEVSGMG